MTSFLSDNILFVALLVTCASVLHMYREIRRLRNDQATFLASMAEANRMFDAIENTLQTVRQEGMVIAETLEARIDEGRALLDQLDIRRRDTSGATITRMKPS
jgi:predicted Holliday junction resolvase-like endonuclease